MWQALRGAMTAFGNLLGGVLGENMWSACASRLGDALMCVQALASCVRCAGVPGLQLRCGAGSTTSG